MIVRGSAICIIAALMISFGCAAGGTPSAFYTLQPAAIEAIVKETAHLQIGIGPVNLPAYLDRDAIVTRLSPNRLKVNDGHRWAGGLKEEILRILVANLKSACPMMTVRALPWSAEEKPNLRFRITLQSFEGRRAGEVALKAAWSVENSHDDNIPLQRTAQFQQAVAGDDFESLTAAMGRALADLSREMAKDVEAMVKNGNIVKPINY